MIWLLLLFKNNKSFYVLCATRRLLTNFRYVDNFLTYEPIQKSSRRRSKGALRILYVHRLTVNLSAGHLCWVIKAQKLRWLIIKLAQKTTSTDRNSFSSFYDYNTLFFFFFQLNLCRHERDY